VNLGDLLPLVQKYGQPMAWLAIAGGAFLGAVGFGLAAQLLTRSLTTRKLPPLAKNTARGIGGLVVGLLTALWVFQGGGGPGGPGPGGPGGPGQPSDHGPPPSAPPDHPSTPTPPDKDVTPGAEGTMQVRVLTGAELDSEAAAKMTYYRLPDGDHPEALHTLAEVKEAIKQAVKKQPPLKRLFIIGPDKSAPWVRDLQTWAVAEQKLQVDNLSPPQ
jgi:hypothetical protein